MLSPTYAARRHVVPLAGGDTSVESHEQRIPAYDNDKARYGLRGFSRVARYIVLACTLSTTPRVPAALCSRTEERRYENRKRKTRLI